MLRAQGRSDCSKPRSFSCSNANRRNPFCVAFHYPISNVTSRISPNRSLATWRIQTQNKRSNTVPTSPASTVCRPIAAGLLAGALLAAAGMSAVRAQNAAREPFTVKVIAFNDFHGNLVSPGSFRADAQSPLVPAGGVDALAGYVKMLQA